MNRVVGHVMKFSVLNTVLFDKDKRLWGCCVLFFLALSDTGYFKHDKTLQKRNFPKNDIGNRKKSISTVDKLEENQS